MLDDFARWLEGTAISAIIRDHLWIIPTVQTVHILGIAIVMSSIGMLALRIFGLAGVNDPIADTARRFTPWIWIALVVLAVTGAILITGEPERSVTNPAFQLKMILLLFAITLTGAFQVGVGKNLAHWTRGATPGVVVKLLTVLALVIWVTIPVAGRWIAYTDLG